jgi:hypothetical protein
MQYITIHNIMIMKKENYEMKSQITYELKNISDCCKLKHTHIHTT